MTSENSNARLEQRVIATLASTFRMPVEALTAVSRMGEPPSWDSMGHMELIVTLEREFGVTFPTYQLPDLISVKSIVNALVELGADAE